MRRCVSLCARAEMRDFISATTLSSSERRLRLVVALRRGEPRAELLREHVGDDRARRRRAEHLLRLPLELRLGQAHREDGGEAGEHVVLLELVVAGLQSPGVLLDLLPQELQQPLLEPGLVRAALRRGDDVDERAARRCRSRCPSAARCRRRHSRCSSVGTIAPAVGEHRHRLGEGAGAREPPDVGERGIRREVLDELGDAALELEGRRVRCLAALVGHVDARGPERGTRSAARDRAARRSGTRRPW